MYTYMLNSVVKISMMFVKYFEYYAIILRGPFFVECNTARWLLPPQLGDIACIYTECR